MAKPLEAWIKDDVLPIKSKPARWLAENYFFRDPVRPTCSDPSYFFSPADGVIIYAKEVEPDECVIDIKGVSYSLRDAMRDSTYDARSLVIGIFMTFYDVHVNRMPYAGRRTYRELPAITTNNLPMLEMEERLLEDLRLDTGAVRYLHENQRMQNRVWAPLLEQDYYILQIADYDIDTIMPFDINQNRQYAQGQRFSQIRYGSQVELVIPLSKRFDFIPMLDVGIHVEAGLDPIVRVVEKKRRA